MRLGIEEVEVLLTRLDNCLVNGDLLGKDRIESAARTNAEHIGKGPAAHIGLDQEHGLAARGDSLGKVDGNRRLALVGNRGRDGNSANGVVQRSAKRMLARRVLAAFCTTSLSVFFALAMPIYHLS